MISEIDRLLRQGGYQYKKVLPKEAGVYYQYTDGVAQVVLGIHAHENFYLEGEQYEQLTGRLRELFLHPQENELVYSHQQPVSDVQILTLIVTGREELYRELCAGYQGIWIFDLNEGRLIIYENQPRDFYGLYDRITQAGVNFGQKAERPAWGRGNIPYVSIGMVAANVLIFLICSVLGDPSDAFFILEHGGMYPEFILADGEWYRVFTSMFLHFGIEHLINNMVMLFFAGRYLEKAMGHVRYLCLYLLSGTGAGIFSLFMVMVDNEEAVSAGASGAVFGIVGGLLWVAIRNKGRFADLTARGLLLMAALSLYYGFSSAGVDNWGHVGGLVGGIILGILLYRKKSCGKD